MLPCPTQEPLSPPPLADDQAPREAAGLRARGRAGRAGACLLPEDRLGEAGEPRDPATLQAQSGELVPGPSSWDSGAFFWREGAGDPPPRPLQFPVGLSRVAPMPSVGNRAPPM